MPEHDVTILRSEKSREYPFVQIDRDTVQDGNLTFESRGLLAYVLSKPRGWKAKHHDLQREGQIGKDALNSILKNLREHGYIDRQKTRGTDGTFKWTLTVYETPDLNPNFTSAENPPMVKQSTSDGLTIDGKPALDIYKGSRAGAGAHSVTNKDQEIKDGSKQSAKKTRRKLAPIKTKQELLFKRITGHRPRAIVLERVIAAMGPEPDEARLKQCYATWIERDYREFGLGWLDWYVNNHIPERKFNGKKQTDRSDGTTRGYGADTERSVLRKGINEK